MHKTLPSLSDLLIIHTFIHPLLSCHHLWTCNPLLSSLREYFMPDIYELNGGCRWLWLGWHLFTLTGGTERIFGYGRTCDDRRIDGNDGQICQIWLSWAWTREEGDFFCCLPESWHQWVKWLEVTNMFHDSHAFESVPRCCITEKKKSH